MNKQLIRFHISLLFVLTISYFVHDYIVSSNHLLLLYTVNFSIAVFVYWIVFLLRNSQKESLGFYFLIGTFLKFFIFFVFILPIFKEDNIVSKVEFFSFFTPYIISLFIETKSLITLLNKKSE